jgi:hypothetical protein
MKDIQKRELIRSIKLIESLGCSFRIITPEGESFGGLKVVEPKPPRIRAERRYPYGSLTKYIKEHVDLNAGVGSVQEIFCTEFDVESLRSAACNILTSTWGKDTYVTVGYPDRFEIMRTGDESVIEEAV